MTKRTKPAAVFDNVDMFAASCKPFKYAKSKLVKLPGVSANYAALPTTKKPRRVKARAMYSSDLSQPMLIVHECETDATCHPVLLIPRTRAAYDAMVEQIVKAIFRADDEPHWNRANLYSYYEKHAVAALKSIGITRPKE